MVMALPPPGSNGQPTVKVTVAADVSSVKPAMQEAAQEIRNLGADTEAAAGRMRTIEQASGAVKDALASMAGGFGDVALMALNAVPLVGVGAVAAFAGLALAAKEGAAESSSLAKTLIMTGNAAGVTVSQLEQMASGVAESSNSTKGAVTGALEEMIKAGDVSSDVMGKAAEAAVLLQRYGGVSIKQTAEAFSDLGKDPLKAALKLNESTNFLTVSIVAQAKALTDQGMAAEAARLVQEKSADSSIERMKEVAENLGHLEKLWHAVEDAAKGAWDRMKDAGRKKSTASLIAEVQQDIERGLTDAYGGESGAAAALAKLKERAKAEADKAEADKLRNESSNASEKLLNDADKYLSNAEKKQRDLATAAKDYRLAISGATEDQALMNKLATAYEKTVAGINEKYADKEKAPKKTQFDRDLEAVDRLKLEGRAADAGLAPQTIKELDALNTVYQKTNMSQDEYLRLAGVAMANDTVIAARNRAVTQEINARAEATQYLNTLQERFNRSNQAKRDSFEILPENQARLRDELRKIDEAAVDTKNRLDRARGEGRLSPQDYEDQMSKLTDTIARQKDEVRSLNSQQDRLNSSWEVGAQRALQKYEDSAKNVAGSTEQAFTRAFSGMEDGLVKFAMTGRMDFQSFANSVIADMLRIQARAALTPLYSGGSSGGGGLLGGLFSAVGGLFGGGSGFTKSGFTDLGSGLSLGSNPTGGGLSFEGGGFTGPGVRSGGVDGRGGFYAIIHPNETVIDHESGGLIVAGGGGSPVSSSRSLRIQIENNGTAQQVTGAQPYFDLDGEVVRIFLTDMDQQGPMARRFESTYQASRAAAAYGA